MTLLSSIEAVGLLELNGKVVLQSFGIGHLILKRVNVHIKYECIDVSYDMVFI